MQAEELFWRAPAGWQVSGDRRTVADLVLYFGARQSIACGSRYRELRDLYPNAHILGCSTGGQIRSDDVNDDEVVATAIKFDTTRVRITSENVVSPESSFTDGETIGKILAADDLAGMFVLSDGLCVNGSQLVAGIRKSLSRDLPLTGGLAGDGSLFNQTLVSADCEPRSNIVAAIGLYGRDIRIGHGSAGGWDVFGPRRRITRSIGNVLYELDGEPALDLYERYLGEEEAKGLPATALLFPIQIYDLARPDHTVVRTVLAIDREQRSMTFAGDVPHGWSAQLMRGQFDHLADGAGDAARQAIAGTEEALTGDKVAVLISCIGRRLLMGQRVTDEVEAAGAELGSRTRRLGFYSYGEISPHAVSGACELHNQTMTITMFSEVTKNSSS